MGYPNNMKEQRFELNMSHRKIVITKQRIIPLDRLSDRNIRDDRIYSSYDYHSEVFMYFVKAKSREVNTWRQPLLRTYKSGQLQLVFQENKKGQKRFY